MAALAAAFLAASPARAQAPSPGIAVEAVTLARTPLTETVSSVGNLVAGELVIIRPEVDGRVVEIGFEEGQPVEAGQMLFRLESAVYQARLREAMARHSQAVRNHERARSLNKRGHASGEILERAKAEMEIAAAGVDVNQAQLEKTRIDAPFAGTIGLRKVSKGAFVEAQTELVTLVSLSPLKVECRLPERYYRVIAEGGLIRAKPDALPGEEFEGRIYAIAPVFDINGRSVTVKAMIANPRKRLRPGMFVRVSLVVDQRNQALVLPESAIVQRGDGQFVYRVEDGRAVLRKVRLGLRQTGRIEVVDGLGEGDTVVTAGQIKLRPGAKVSIASRTPGDGQGR